MTEPESSLVDELKARSESIFSIEDVLSAVGQRRLLAGELKAAGPPARLLLAENYLRLAQLLEQSGDAEEALSELWRVVSEFDDLPLDERRVVLIEAFWRIALYSFGAGQYAETVDAADAFMRGGGAVKDFAGKVAGILYNKSRALGKLGRTVEQRQTLTAIITEFRASPDREARDFAGMAMFTLASNCMTDGEWEAAVKLWSDVFESFKDEPPRRAPRLPFNAQRFKVRTLLVNGRIEEGVAATQKLIATGAAPGSTVARESGRTLIQVGLDLERAGELQAALSAFQAASDRLLAEPDEELRKLGVYAEINVGVILGRLGDDGSRGDEGAAMAGMQKIVRLGEPTLAVLDDIIARAPDPTAGLSKDREPWALLLKGAVLQYQDRVEEAQASYAQLVDQFHSNQSPTIQMLVASARHALAREPGGD